MASDLLSCPAEFKAFQDERQRCYAADQSFSLDEMHKFVANLKAIASRAAAADSPGQVLRRSGRLAGRSAGRLARDAADDKVRCVPSDISYARSPASHRCHAGCVWPSVLRGPYSITDANRADLSLAHRAPVRSSAKPFVSAKGARSAAGALRFP